MLNTPYCYKHKLLRVWKLLGAMFTIRGKGLHDHTFNVEPLCHVQPRLDPFFSRLVPALRNTLTGCLGKHWIRFPRFIIRVRIPSYTIFWGNHKIKVKRHKPAKVGTGRKSETQPSAAGRFLDNHSEHTPNQRRQGSLSGQALKGFNLQQGQKVANMGELNYADVEGTQDLLRFQ